MMFKRSFGSFRGWLILKRLLHPFFFSLAALLYIYCNGSLVTAPGQMLRPFAVVWGVLALLAGPAYKVFRSWERAGYFLSFIVFTFFFPFNFFKAASVSVLLAFLIWSAYLLIRRRPLKSIPGVMILNVISAVLMLYLSWTALQLFLEIPWRTYESVVSRRSHPASIALTSPDAPPDIYYIVLDGYARADILQQYYGYDNSPFLDELRSRGFTVLTQNHSNYPKTVPSIASTLNMEYVQMLVPSIEDVRFWWMLEPYLDQSVVSVSLAEIGYQSVATSSNWSVTDNRAVDVYLQPYPVMLNGYECYLLGSTPLKLLQPSLQPVASVGTNETHRTVVQFAFDSLAELPDMPGPKFVFVHIISPHPPFVFDAEGNPFDSGYPFSFSDASDFPGTRDDYRRYYIEQMKYINAEILKAVDAILANSDIPPVILLQADHGPGAMTDFIDMQNSCLAERFSPLAAYYLPGVEAGEVPDDMSSVNLFRFVFNQYFGTELPMLPDIVYSYNDPTHIYNSLDVTSEVDALCPNPNLP